MRWPRRAFDAVMSPKGGDSKTALFVFLLIAMGVMAAVFVFAVVARIYGVDLGTFGDFFGGVVNPILTFLTFVGLLITIITQQSEIREARADASAQAFETLFFQMLTIHNEIVNSMDLRQPGVQVDSSTAEWHGRDCFERFYRQFQAEYHASIKSGAPEPVQHAWNKSWKRNQKDLGHYFRFLYNMIRVVDESGASTTRYMKLLRAQLSDYELLMLLYNGITEKGFNFRPYIESYSLLDNLPQELLLHKDHVGMYSPRATDDAYLNLGDDPIADQGTLTAFVDRLRARNAKMHEPGSDS